MSAGQKKYAFIGGGNMGEALIKGLLKSGLAKSQDIVVAEPLAERRQYLKQEYRIAVDEDNKNAVKEAGIVVLAVKPQVIDKALKEIGQILDKNQLVISIAAGVKIERIESFLPEGTPVIRTMPNTPALVLCGATAMAPGKSVLKKHLKQALALFEAVGVAVEVEEKHMDAVTGLSGSGPAYVFIFLEALADGGVLQGLSREQALTLAAQTIFGSARLALEPGAHPGRLKDMVASPGGTTITGLQVLERGGLRGLIMDAVAAAAKRSSEL